MNSLKRENPSLPSLVFNKNKSFFLGQRILWCIWQGILWDLSVAEELPPWPIEMVGKSTRKNAYRRWAGWCPPLIDILKVQPRTTVFQLLRTFLSLFYSFPSCHDEPIRQITYGVKMALNHVRHETIMDFFFFFLIVIQPNSTTQMVEADVD